MKLFFVTTNPGKFEEVKAMLPEIEQLDIELPEIQDIDPNIVVAAKLREACWHAEAMFIVEDTSLSLDCLNGFPGPLIKWVEKSIGNEGIYELTQKYQNTKATARTVFGFAAFESEFQYFHGTIEGHIRKPSGDKGFGWDKIFAPGNSERTFAQMSADEKNEISMRKIALLQLKEYLVNEMKMF
jgi:inosine triphosphate pyrophosphatase